MDMNRRIENLSKIAFVLLIAVSLRIVYWQVGRGRDLYPIATDPVAVVEVYNGDQDFSNEPVSLADLPLPVQQRTLGEIGRIARGTIYDSQGKPVAYTQTNEDGSKWRVYPEPALAHVVGYANNSGIGLVGPGVAGIEHAYNGDLLGVTRIDSRIRQALNAPREGNDVHLTINSDLQQQVAVLLGARPGSVVVLDAHTGAVQAMVNYPTFDPITLRVICESAVCEGAYLNRATQGRLTPGSTWKTVTLVAALELGQATPDTVFDAGEPTFPLPNVCYSYRVLDGREIPDLNHCDRQLTLRESYQLSANTTFARLGDEMSPEVLEAYAERFGIGRNPLAPPIDIAASAPSLTQDIDQLYSDDYLQATTGIGQGELFVSPLNMALIAASVVNDGDVPMPHLVQAVRTPRGRLLQDAPNQAWLPQAMEPTTAATVREMMIAVVEDGTGVAAQIPEYIVGGKTGTAQLADGQAPHSWFIGFVEDNEQALAIAVVVENGGEGSDVAAPLFQAVGEVVMGFSAERESGVKLIDD